MSQSVAAVWVIEPFKPLAPGHLITAAHLGDIGDTVIVGHNVGFDVAFIRAALERAGRPRLEGTIVDTVHLARRLVRDEVPNCKLSTLSSRLRLDHQPPQKSLCSD